jgi:hypothetical protein
MEAAPIPMPGRRGVWVRAIAGACLSAASALAYLAYMAQGIVVGALIALPGREQDIVTAEQRGTYWFVVSLFCQSMMIVVIAPLIPFASDEKPVTRLIVRVVFGAVVSLPLTVLVGIVMFTFSAGLQKLFTR